MTLTDELLETLCMIRNTQCCNCRNGYMFNNLGQGRIIALLKQKGSLRTVEIASCLNINVSTANEFISKLIKQGYVKRSIDSNDKRVKRVSLTELGKNVELSSTLSDHIFDNLSKEQLLTFQNSLNVINNNLKKMLKK